MAGEDLKVSAPKGPDFAGGGFPDTVTVLAIESSTRRAGVALLCGDIVAVEFVAEKPRIHSVWLLPAAMEAMRVGGVMPHDVGCIAVSEGPGSFTGLRIGFSTAQGLAVAWSRPVVPVPSFLVISAGASMAGWKGYALLASEWSRESAITALYLTDGRGGARELLEPQDRDLDLFLDKVQQRMEEDGAGERNPPEAVCLGEAAEALVEAQVRRIRKSSSAQAEGLHLMLGDPYLALPRPGILASIGRAMFIQDKAVPPEKALPRYYRQFHARGGVAEGRP